MIRSVFLLAAALLLTLLYGCAKEPENVPVIGVDFKWQQQDKGAQDNPEIRLTGVPEGTQRFLVSLTDLDLKGFDHGSGYANNDGSGIIARGAIKGAYNGPDPPYPSVIHTYEISVKALDADDNVIGFGKKAKEFLFNDLNKATAK
jgi:phosphatidylethanolamine-binding protein (PEBP) family uncharacterized protein